MPAPDRGRVVYILLFCPSHLFLTPSPSPHMSPAARSAVGMQQDCPISYTDVLEDHIHVLEGCIDVLEANVSVENQVPVAQGWQPQAGASQPPMGSEPPATAFLASIPHAAYPASPCLASPCPLPPDTVTSACPFKTGIIIDIMFFGPIVKC